MRCVNESMHGRAKSVIGANICPLFVDRISKKDSP